MMGTSVADEFALAKEAYATPEVRFLSEKQHGAFILAVLRSTFTRELPAVVDNDFHEALDHAIGALRDRGETGVPDTNGRALATSWVADGWLEKDLSSDGQMVYRPTAASQTVMEWLDRQSRQRLVSVPRVNQIFDNVAKLAALADPDRDALIREHEREAKRHQAEAERLKAGGDVPAGTDDDLLQYADLVVGAMNEIPSDFRRVGERFHDAKRDLQDRLLTTDGETVGQVIQSVTDTSRNIMTGTPQGRAFEGVSELIRDEAQMGSLRHNLNRIMNSPAADMFTDGERVMFANLPAVFVTHVDLVLEGPRALTKIVGGRLAAHVDASEGQGGLLSTIRAARAALRTHKGPVPHGAIPTLGPLTVPGSTLRLHDPRPVDAPRSLADAPAAVTEPLTLEYLARWGGPHGKDVADHVRRLFAAGRDRVTLAEAWQVAPSDLRRSVELVAYLGHPARSHDRPRGTDVITVSEGDRSRKFMIPRVEFTNEQVEQA